MKQKITGILSPVITPFDETLAPDTERWLAHCRWLLKQDCGLAIFGTNSEANSLSLAERLSLLDAALEAGLDPNRMMPGSGACALPDAIKLTDRAVKGGCAGVLMLPPFYYKGVSDDGLFAFYDRVIQAVGDSALRIYLYHIPLVSQIPISLSLIERLLKAHPNTVAGIKDSSGDWTNTMTMLENFDNFDVFVGSERFLLAGMRHGAVGCISATANITPAAIQSLYQNWQAEDADDQQAGLTSFREAIESYPMIPALKASIAWARDDPAWSRVRPPLVGLGSNAMDNLSITLKQSGFSMT
jgi:4-hydroxy-tetrahydrodipicolinate synthase